jgi:SAM-dependent methyltransferase
VLDCGSGRGHLARAAAGRGARVTGFDVSSGMLRTAATLDGSAERVRYVASTFERLPFHDEAFEAATGMFVLHHVDLAPAARELARVLAPGAQASFIETWQRNPLIRLGRRLRGRMGVASHGTAEERPLMPSDMAALRRAGFDVRVEHPVFVFFKLVENNLLRGRLPWLARLLERFDRALTRVPWLRPFGYYCVVRVRRAA